MKDKESHCSLLSTSVDYLWKNILMLITKQNMASYLFL